MFSTSFDIFLTIILSVLAVVFLLGKGRGIMDAFGGKNQVKKKRSPEEERWYQRAIGLFIIPLAIVEAISIFVPSSAMGIVQVAVVVVDLIVFVKMTKDR